MTSENASSPKQESPFAKMYQPNGEAFNSEFARLYEVNFGGSAKGAEIHHGLLAKWCKSGFSYHGKWPKDKIQSSRYANNPDFYFVDEAFDTDGNPSDDSVTIFKRIPEEE